MDWKEFKKDEVILLIILLIAIFIMTVPGCRPKPNAPFSGSDAVAISPMLTPHLSWTGKHPDAEAWTEHLLGELSKSDFVKTELRDGKDFCPNISNLNFEQRVLFYAELVAKMTQFESSFRPESIYRECSKKKSTYGSNGVWHKELSLYCLPGHRADGGIAISRGLMQMSYGSALSYGCVLHDPPDLHNPYLSLSCAVKIIDRWVTRDRRLGGKSGSNWQGLARYWSVMRSSSGSYPKIKSYMRNIPICR